MSEQNIQANMTNERVIVTVGSDLTGVWLASRSFGNSRVSVVSLQLVYKGTVIGLDEVTATVGNDYDVTHLHISRDAEIYEAFDDDFEDTVRAVVAEVRRCFVRTEVE